MKQSQPSDGRLAIVGMFDGVHRGHRSMLAEAAAAAEEAGLTPVAVTFRDHPMRTLCPDRCPQLIMRPEERIAELAGAVGTESLLLDFDHDVSRLTAREFMARLRDRYGVKAMYMGYNHHFGSDRLTDPEEYNRIGESLGIKVMHGAEYRENGHKVSSSEIRKALAAGNVALASDMLGHPFALSGTVVGGKQLGRTIGFPTANIKPASSLLIVPATGVYMCDITIDSESWRGRPLRAMVNIGRRPTVDSPGAAVSIEAHILDFSGSIYGCCVRLDFISRLRDEVRFSSLEQLVSQLKADAAEVRRLSHHL